MAKIKQVFISHATEDAQFAHRLADDLQRLGVQVWIAPESIRPGESWVSAIERGLEESSHVVVVLTPAALESKWVKKETDVTIAQERKGRIQVIPLDVKPCEVPLLLSSYQMVSFRRSYDAGLSELANILDVHVTPPELVRLPRHMPPRVAVPETVLPIPTERPLPFEPQMVRIPAGEFLMGTREEDVEALQQKYGGDQRWWNAQAPQHKVHLPDYEIGKYPVTNFEYQAFVQDIGHEPPDHWDGDQYPEGLGAHPVVNVSWHDAVAYCEWLSQKTGKPYRLPTEAEWEKAARGTDGQEFPWGDEWDASKCNTREGGPGTTTPVGQYSPDGDSPYGVADMAGNVWGWCADWFQAYPGNRFPDKNYGEKYRVLRGGSWLYVNERYARCSFRSSAPPADFYGYFGFRVMVSARSLP